MDLCENIRRRLGRVVLEDNKKSIGNVMGENPERVLGENWESWESIGRVLCKPWESHRRVLGESWESLRRVLGDYWERFRRALEES